MKQPCQLETQRTGGTAAQGVPDPFWGETVFSCVTADSFTAFHYMRNEFWTVSSLNFHLTALHCIKTFTVRPQTVSRTCRGGIFPQELDFDLAIFEEGLKRRSLKQMWGHPHVTPSPIQIPFCLTSSVSLSFLSFSRYKLQSLLTTPNQAPFPITSQTKPKC